MKQNIASFIRSQPAKTFAKNEVLLQQGDKPQAIYALRSGLIKISDISSDGCEQTLWFAKKYDVVPLEWLFDASQTSPFFYTAHTEVEVFVISKDDFLEHIRDNSKVLFEINRMISTKQKQLLQHIGATLKPKARDKITHMLYHLGLRFYENDKTPNTTIQLTHQNIADLVGITRETASLELLTLKKEGFINYDKQGVTIHTPKLVEIVDTA